MIDHPITKKIQEMNISFYTKRAELLSKLSKAQNPFEAMEIVQKWQKERIEEFVNDQNTLMKEWKDHLKSLHKK